jgi:beta-lactamase regulating signal transducer with metallopeptidase domain
MDADWLEVLTRATLASSLAVLLVGLLRKPFRAVAGARAAYWLWLFVPALMLAFLLPAPTQSLQVSSVSLPGQVRSAISAVAVTTNIPGGSMALVAVLCVWAAGACAMFGLLLRRQRSFARSLGTLQPDPNGFHRSGGVAAPMLVGAWNPRIVVPLDFETRYSPEERELILAHERAHLLRCDVAVNAIAAGWLCFFWFNPLAYWALDWLRIDQELASDAHVLAQRSDARRSYADVLLKTQLASESGWRVPVGCQWQSTHSLKERIVMLKRPLPGIAGQLMGVACVIALTGFGNYAAWAAQAAVDKQGARVLVKMRVTAVTNNAKSKDTYSAATEYVVHSGEASPPMNATPYDFACIAILPGEPASPARKAREARGLPAPAAGQILLDCTVRHDGEVVATPSVLAADGHLATIETSDTAGLRRYKIELKATASEERIAEALKTEKR